MRSRIPATLPPAILAAACVALGLCGCQAGEAPADSPAAEQALTTVTLQLNWKPEPQFGGFYAAQMAGAYARNRLAVAINPGGAGAPTIDMVGAGTVPFGIVSADEIVRARSIGNHVVALFAVYQTNPQGIMTRASRGFTSLADVFAHPGTLAMERGLPYAQFLEKRYGFEQVRIVPSPYGDLSLYRSDEDYAMQCFVTSEPLAAAKTEFAPQTFLIADSGYNPYTTVLATSDAYLANHPETVAAMVRAVREGWRDYLVDPTPTNAMMGELNPTMDAETFAASAQAQRPLIETEATATEGVGTMTLARWQELVDQLLELGVVEGAVGARDCFVAELAN
jgi:NitT/TauT family transport system substrate-binding protein